MSWTMCTSGQAITRAGVNANSTIISYSDPTILDSFSDQVEGLIEAETGLAIIDNWAGYKLSGAANMAAAAKIAMAIVGYDVTGYLTREADTVLNVNDQDYKLAIKNIKQLNKNTLNNPN